MMILKYGKKHEELLKKVGIDNLVEAQKSWNSDDDSDIIHDKILPYVIDGDEETSEIAEDLITMITCWEVGQTEGEIEDEDDYDE